MILPSSISSFSSLVEYPTLKRALVPTICPKIFMAVFFLNYSASDMYLFPISADYFFFILRE